MIDLNKVQFDAPHDEIRAMIYVDNGFVLEVSLMTTDDEKHFILGWSASKNGKDIAYQDTTIFTGEG